MVIRLNTRFLFVFKLWIHLCNLWCFCCVKRCLGKIS